MLVICANLLIFAHQLRRCAGVGVVEADECRGLSPLLVVDHLPEVERGRDEALPAVRRVEGDGSAQVLKLPKCPRVDLQGSIFLQGALFCMTASFRDKSFA